MHAEGGAGAAGLTSVKCSVKVGVGCDLVLFKALMRPDPVVEASGTQDVVAAQRSPTESNLLDGGRRNACTGHGAGSAGQIGGQSLCGLRKFRKVDATHSRKKWPSYAGGDAEQKSLNALKAALMSALVLRVWDPGAPDVPANRRLGAGRLRHPGAV
jgi:hypothetical protein